MGNPFIPLPRIENALIIGDRTAECLQLNFCIGGEAFGMRCLLS